MKSLLQTLINEQANFELDDLDQKYILFFYILEPSVLIIPELDRELST